jgi:hypothetical protein
VLQRGEPAPKKHQPDEAQQVARYHLWDEGAGCFRQVSRETQEQAETGKPLGGEHSTASAGRGKGGGGGGKKGNKGKGKKGTGKR